MTKNFIVGATSSSPQDGQSKFTSDFLGECLVNYLIIDNQLYNQMQPDGQFKHLYQQNLVDISPLTFVLGSHISFDITPIKLTTTL